MGAGYGGNGAQIAATNSADNTVGIGYLIAAKCVRTSNAATASVNASYDANVVYYNTYSSAAAFSLPSLASITNNYASGLCGLCVEIIQSANAQLTVTASSGDKFLLPGTGLLANLNMVNAAGNYGKIRLTGSINNVWTIETFGTWTNS